MHHQFTCPKCGSHQFGSSNCTGPGEIVRHCHGYRCTFTFPESEDHKYFREEEFLRADDGTTVLISRPIVRQVRMLEGHVKASKPNTVCHGEVRCSKCNKKMTGVEINEIATVYGCPQGCTYSVLDEDGMHKLPTPFELAAERADWNARWNLNQEQLDAAYKDRAAANERAEKSLRDEYYAIQERDAARAEADALRAEVAALKSAMLAAVPERHSCEVPEYSDGFNMCRAHVIDGYRAAGIEVAG